jgi:hypothetical protein
VTIMTEPFDPFAPGAYDLHPAAPVTAPLPPPVADAAAAHAPRGRRLPQVALALGLLASVAVGVGCYAALATIDVTSFDPAGVPLAWLTVVVVGGAIGTVAVIISVVALVRVRRLVSVMALLVSLLLPTVVGLVGLQTGLNSLHSHIAKELSGASSAAIATLEAALEKWGPVGDPIREWLRSGVGNG